MNSLVIDTSSHRTIVGLFEGESELFADFHEGAMDHGEALPRLVHSALQITDQIHQVFVGMGPGPYTGLRVGIVFAQTFAQARNIPCIGKCSLDAIHVPTHHSYVVATDARRKEIYWAKYDGGIRTSGPHVGTIENVDELNEVKFGFGFGEVLFPSPRYLLKAHDVITHPLYLRRPDAIPTSERS